MTYTFKAKGGKVGNSICGKDKMISLEKYLPSQEKE